ncbi:hypothetical protein HOT75_gp024 [Gordonia phage Daredevil]|uniref:Uncharacterized protein n=1 Tax=Gordonia phage Daredevil TaxID=2283286 RepID=A0A345MIN1_9CAUD|nr:hypothetical protein HOT75_gp024 [Gordonia phage Daredevil]AXH70412.1 hypothetical protein SEA_DAREDEVIL_24 [Gordonia phage Daredevil]
MAAFEPVTLVHHRTGEECKAYSAVGLNNLVAAGFARKNEVRRSNPATSEKAAGDAESAPSTEVSTPVEPVTPEAPAEGVEKPETSTRAKRR